MIKRFARYSHDDDKIIQGLVIIDQKRTPCVYNRQAVILEYRSIWVSAIGVFSFRYGIFIFVEDVFCIREHGDPAAVMKTDISGRLVNVQMGTEHVIHNLKSNAERIYFLAQALFFLGN